MLGGDIKSPPLWNLDSSRRESEETKCIMTGSEKYTEKKTTEKGEIASAFFNLDWVHFSNFFPQKCPQTPLTLISLTRCYVVVDSDLSSVGLNSFHLDLISFSKFTLFLEGP